MAVTQAKSMFADDTHWNAFCSCAAGCSPKMLEQERVTAGSEDYIHYYSDKLQLTFAFADPRPPRLPFAASEQVCTRLSLTGKKLLT
jgi:hypothetical protein